MLHPVLHTVGLSVIQLDQKNPVLYAVDLSVIQLDQLNPVRHTIDFSVIQLDQLDLVWCTEGAALLTTPGSEQPGS